MRVSNDVLNVLSRAEVDGNKLILTGQLDRNMYVQVNKIIEAAGGKWDRKAKAHVFSYEAEQRIDEIILTGEVEVPKDEFNYFPTPPEVVARLLEIADIRPGMRVLEPSAGQGAIASECEAAGGIVDCIELNAANFLILSKNFLVVKKEDFLTVDPSQVYDRVVMNPPFAKQQDIKHVNHALKFLKPDGLLVAIMASSVTFRDNKLTQDFRDLVRDRGGEIEALPEGSFKASGTMVNTVIAAIPA